MTSLAPSMRSLEDRYRSTWNNYRILILQEAEIICREGLTENADQPHLLHLRGLLAIRAGQPQFALACLERAVALQPAQASCRIDLGALLERMGRLVDAEKQYRDASTLVSSARVLCRLGRNLMRQGRFAESTQVYEGASRLEPNLAVIDLEVGDLNLAQGRFALAVACYERAIQLDPAAADGYQRLGCLHMRAERPELAIPIFREGIRRQPRRVDLHASLGETLLRVGQLREAVSALDVAVSIDPYFIDAWRFLVLALELLREKHEATDAWFRLGQALERRDAPAEAASAYREALARKPDCLRALVRLGWVNLQLRKSSDAITCFETALAISPGHATAHQRLGWSHAHAGNLDRTWEEIAWSEQHALWKRFEQPVWDGTPLEGKTLFLRVDVGLGDTIQMLRYLPLAKARGARVVVECRQTLATLIARQSYVDQIVGTNTPVPRFDVQASIYVLPRVFRTTRSNIPNQVPYLVVAPQLVDAWLLRLDTTSRRRVGLVWASSASDSPSAIFRSVPLRMFGALNGFNNLVFVSLQFGLQVGELLVSPEGLRIECPLDESCTVHDTAAVIMNLDLVITVDTMVAHLAGALGKPVWTLLPFAPAWMWEAEGDTTPWYPTMRLFRQARPGDWEDVLQRVRAALSMFLQEAAVPTVGADADHRQTNSGRSDRTRS